MVKQYMLTTVDNPYDPFTEFDAWETWDRTHDYNTTAYLARATVTSDELSEADVMSAIERAMTEIVANDPLNMYVMVSKDIDIDNRPSVLVREIEEARIE